MTIGIGARLIPGVCAAVATVLALAGCTSSSSPGDAGPPAASAPAPNSSAAGREATSPAGGSASAAAAHAIDVCATVDAAKVRELTGAQITEAHPESALSSQEYGCGYSNADDTVQVQLTVFEHNAKSSYDLFSSQSKNATQVPGLGDKAFYDNDETMYVLSGDYLIQVNGLDGADHCAALARPLLAAL